VPRGTEIAHQQKTTRMGGFFLSIIITKIKAINKQ